MARQPRLIRPGFFKMPGLRLGVPPRISRFLFRFIVCPPYAAFAKAVSNSYAVLPPGGLRWIESMTRSSPRACTCRSRLLRVPPPDEAVTVLDGSLLPRGVGAGVVDVAAEDGLDLPGIEELASVVGRDGAHPVEGFARDHPPERGGDIVDAALPIVATTLFTDKLVTIERIK